MKRISLHPINPIACLCLASALFYPCTALPETCEPSIAQAVSIEGLVEVQRAGGTQWRSVQREEAFCPGDTLRVGDNSRAALSVADQPLLRLDQNTTITLGGMEERRGSIVDLAKGAIHFFSRISRNLEVRTGFVNAGVEGTEGLIRVEEDRTVITIYDGRVLASNAAGSLAVTSGQTAEAEAGKAPVGRIEVRPRDAVNWALYYPPVMLFAPGEVPPEDPGNPRFRVYRASQLIAVGRVDAAEEDIRRALELDPQNSDALALQAIVFVVQNQKQKAIETAREAVAADPGSAAAHIALSYAQQAAFDLESALASVQKAVRLGPDSALAWARLAELQASFGRLDTALDAAQKATELEPDLSRTQMVLGFAYLTQVNTNQARTAFNKAIALDQADPLSHLGLGLAKIREGELEAGAREIEIAASLDPNNAIVRSYLGKTYYEQKRGKLDEREYQIAKELDPEDPTPYFYDAIAKQTTNRPVEALSDFERAIELNDNRAVYRSTLNLDSDLAARSAATARIYSDIGFQQLALVEGWKSVNTDPGNYSAHRFLADSYAARPRHEIARVSELLQSQLLQPQNMTPIQPQLAESNLFLISSQGTANVSFNEFNPLFTSNGVAVQGSGIVGNNDTFGNEAILSGINDRFSFSSGYAYFDTDGWRDNANQRDTILNLFTQYELSYKTSIQAEYRYRDTESGDLQLRFFEDEFLPNQEAEEERHALRVGFHHAFTPASDLIGNFQYTREDRSLRNENPDPVVTFPIFNFDLEAENDEALGGELSYLHRSNALNIIGGIGHFDIKAEDDVAIFFEFPAPPPVVLNEFTADNDVKHTNLYAYSYFKPFANLTLTMGASYDDFNPDDEDEYRDRNQVNPKFGVSWNPLPDTTIRAAAFRVLKRTMITDQTLEPTQVAGFNQFFDEINATDYWVYGGGFDQKFTNIFIGAEYTYRDLEVPFNDTTGPTPDLTTVDWEEQVFRTYFFWTPHDWIALSAEYIHEDLDRDRNFNLNAKDVETHYVPLGINFFHPSGLSTSFKGTYVNQEGNFNRLDSLLGVTEGGEDDFWLLDAAIKYRLPKRHGFFTLGVHNLTDENFEYYDSDFNNPRFQPDRLFFVKVTLSFP